MIDFIMYYSKEEGPRIRITKNGEIKSDYPSPHTLQAIEERVATMSQPKPDERDTHSLEDDKKFRLPKLNKTFYSLVRAKIEFPSFEDFFNRYIQRNFETNNFTRVGDTFIHNITKLPYPFWDIHGRCCRTYSSLVRDFHYYHYAMSHEWFQNNCHLRYSLQDDLAGIDISIFCRGYKFGIELNTDTPRGNGFSEEKDISRRDKINVHPKFFKKITMTIRDGSETIDLYRLKHLRIASDHVRGVTNKELENAGSSERVEEGIFDI